MKLEFEEAVEVMHKIHKVFSEVISKHGGNVNHYQMRTLFMIDKHKIDTVKQLKDEIINHHKDAPKEELARMEVKIAKMFKELIEMELITLDRSESDARCKIITITDKGRKFLDMILEESNKVWKEINND